MDDCLEKKDGMSCGSTDHFTSFAVLLGGAGGGEGSGCGSSNVGTSIYVYLSAAAIGISLFVIFVVTLAYEIYKRYLKKKSHLRDRRLTTYVSKMQSYT